MKSYRLCYTLYGDIWVVLLPLLLLRVKTEEVLSIRTFDKAPEAFKKMPKPLEMENNVKILMPCVKANIQNIDTV